jgi:hypothetical protein
VDSTDPATPTPAGVNLRAVASAIAMGVANAVLFAVAASDDLTAKLMNGRYSPGGAVATQGLIVLSAVLGVAAVTGIIAARRRGTSPVMRVAGILLSLGLIVYVPAASFVAFIAFQ